MRREQAVDTVLCSIFGHLGRTKLAAIICDTLHFVSDTKRTLDQSEHPDDQRGIASDWQTFEPDCSDLFGCSVSLFYSARPLPSSTLRSISR